MEDRMQTEEFSFTVKLDMEKKVAVVIYGGQSMMDISTFKSIDITCIGCKKVIAIPVKKLESFYHKCTE
jgi:hypothetical protein